MSNIFKKKVFLSWVWVVLCSIAIFLTIPVARSIQRFVYKNWGRETFIYFVLGVLGIGTMVLIYFLIFELKIRLPSRNAWLFEVT